MTTRYALMVLSKQGWVLDGGAWKDKLTWSTRLVFDSYEEAAQTILRPGDRVVEYHSPAWDDLLETVVLR